MKELKSFLEETIKQCSIQDATDDVHQLMDNVKRSFAQKIIAEYFSSPVEPEVMQKAEFLPIVAHIVIKNKIAENELENFCGRWGNELYIDFTQSLSSYKAERK